jgi:quercetin dioxygenase-like cupin family protein
MESTGTVYLKSLVRSGEGHWKSHVGPGLMVKILRKDKSTGESTLLMKMAPGAAYPAHRHPGGEQVLVLEGEVRFSSDLLKPGDYLYTPPELIHAAYSEKGCLLFITAPKPPEML